MEHIHKYLSNKITNKKFSNDLTEIVKELINVYFFDSDDAKKEIYENMIMNSAFKNQDFKDFRIFGWKDGHYCDKDVEKVLTPFQSYDVIEVYTKLMEEYDGDLVEDIVDNIENSGDYPYDDVDSSADTYRIYSDEFFVAVDSEQGGFLIEGIDESTKHPNQSFSVYNYDHNRYIELSRRPIIAEVDGITDEISDRFWYNYEEICDQYIDNLENEFNEQIEVKMLGSGGKHVCIAPSIYAIHYYDKIMERVKFYQDCLVQDAQEEVDYLIDEINTH